MSEDHAADVQRYIDGVLDGSIVTGRLQRLAVWRHVDDLKFALARGFYFDESIAWNAIDFSLCCRQTDGEWAGLPLQLRLEQKFIVWNLFGWRQKSDGLRRFRHGQIEVARKAGKTVMIAFLVLLLLYADTPPEPGAQIYCAATKLEQALLVWNAAAAMVQKSPELAEEARVWNSQNRHEIKLPEFDSVFRPLAKDKTPDGFSPHAIIKDEEHAYRKHMTSFVNTLSSGFGSRRQPLTLTITTYGTDESDIWLDSHAYAVKVLESVITGEIVNDAWFVFIAAIDRDADCPCFRCKGDTCPWCQGSGVLPIDDEFDEACWIKANPGIGQTPKWERMREWATEAKGSPLKHAEFLQKSVNVITTAKTKLILPEVWMQSAGELSERIHSVVGHGGVDLGRSNDLASVGVCFPFAEVDDDGSPFTRYEILSQSWTVEERVKTLKTAQIDRWIADGKITAHPGDSVDFNAVQDWILEWNRQFTVRTWAFDERYAKQMGQNLQAEGLEVFWFTQAHKYYTEPIREFSKLLGKFRIVNGIKVPMLTHNGCPVLAWQACNLVVDRNAKGEQMPDKSRPENKIDAMVAILMAFSECLYDQSQQMDGYYLKNPLAIRGGDTSARRELKVCPECENTVHRLTRRCPACDFCWPELEAATAS